MKNRRIAVIGATSAIAEHCARLWLTEAAADITLVGRDPGKLERVAADLAVRSPLSSVRVLQADFVDPDAIRKLVDGIVADGALDIVLIAHGTLPNQAACQNDLSSNRDALLVNAISPVLFAEVFVGHMQTAGRGTLAIIGSVAGDRGRKSNYIYGAAKGLVMRYAQGLQHRLALAGSNVKVVLVKPGPTTTPMTAHLPPAGLAGIEDVARVIVKAVAQGKPVCYAPGKWAVIMMIIRHLPNFIFNKMDI